MQLQGYVKYWLRVVLIGIYLYYLAEALLRRTCECLVRYDLCERLFRPDARGHV